MINLLDSYFILDFGLINDILYNEFEKTLYLRDLNSVGYIFSKWWYKVDGL